MDEVADWLGIHRNSVHRAARQGRLPARRVGKERRFLAEAVPARWTPGRRLRGPAEATLSGSAFPESPVGPSIAFRPGRRGTSGARAPPRFGSTWQPTPTRPGATSATEVSGTRRARMVRHRQPRSLASSEHYRVKAVEQTLAILDLLTRRVKKGARITVKATTRACTPPSVRRSARITAVTDSTRRRPSRASDAGSHEEYPAEYHDQGDVDDHL